MRRFISYLALGFGALILVGATFTSVFTKAHTSYEYTTSNAYTFRLSDKNGFLEDDTIDDVVTIFNERLKTAGVAGYEIKKEGVDTVEVTYTATSDKNYKYVKDYLCTDGSLAFGTENNVLAIGNEFKGSNKAYLTFDNIYPTIVLPINPDSAQFKTVFEDLELIYQKNQNSGDGTEEGESKEKPTTYLYVLRNYNEGDTITEVISSHSDYDESKSENLLMQFVYTTDGIYLNSNKTEIAVSINIGANDSGLYSAIDLRNATQLGNYFVNCLNASELPCDIECIYSESVPAKYGELINYSIIASPAWSGTLIATLLSIVFVSLVLVLFYRWSALAIVSMSLLSVFGGLAITIFFNAEISIAAIIGLIIVTVGALASGIIYQTKLKEECYRGRSLKKANSEASKKSLLPIVDIHLALIIIGAFTFLFGGTPLVPLAATIVFGGLCSLLCNTLFLKGLMWLLTNNTAFVGKYNVIGVNPDKIPDLMKEEGQKYFGPYEGRNVTKYKKPTAIIASIIGVAALAGTIVFGAINGGTIFNHNLTSNGGTITFETTSNTIVYDINDVNNTLANVKVSTDNGATYSPLKYSNILKYERTVTEKDESDSNVKVNYTYIVADVTENYPSTALATYVNLEEGITLSGLLEDVISDITVEEGFDSKCSSTYRNEVALDNKVPSSPLVLLGVGISIVVMALYLAARYGLSRGISSFVMAIVNTIIPIGFMALTRIATTETLIFVAPFLAFLSFTVSIIFMNKDKEMAKDDFVRNQNNSAENRLEIMKKSTALAFAPALLITLLAGYISLNFAGLAKCETSTIYLVMLGGALVIGYLTTELLMPLAHKLFASMQKNNIGAHKAKKKKKVSTKVKTAEPEEAIFIGINDY